jgi:hypothetical protein
MVKIRQLGLLLVLMATAGVTNAQDNTLRIEQRLTPEQLRETGLDTLTPIQLARLNQLLNASPAAPVAPVAATIPVMLAPTIAKPAMATPALGTSQAITATLPTKELDEDKPLFGFNDAPIKSRLKGTVTDWDEGTVFTLENGQQWKVLKGKMKLPKPITDPEIRVVPGLVGRWFLEVHEDYPKARVYLIN